LPSQPGDGVGAVIDVWQEWLKVPTGAERAAATLVDNVVTVSCVVAGGEQGDQAGAAVGGPNEQRAQRPPHGRVDVGKKFHTVTHGDTHRLGQDVIVVTWWHLEDASNRGIERPAATRSGCQVSSVA
jgi:hypothetical protein